MLSNIWGILRTLIFGIVVFMLIRSCISDSSSSTEYVTEEIPTQGLITTVAEIEKDNFKIESEEPVDQVDDSRIISKYLDGSRDTFTLQEAKLIQTSSDTTRRRRSIGAGSMGFWFFMMSGRMGGGHTPRSSAYVNNDAYQRTQNNAGSRLRSTARTTNTGTRSKSGYGKGRSGRSYGG